MYPTFRFPAARPAVPAVLALIAFLVVAACGGQTGPTADPSAPAPSVSVVPSVTPTPTSPAFPLELIDDEGTAVAIPAKPTRIVSLTPAATEILFSIGAAARLVARVEDVALFPPEAEPLPVVATYEGVDIERIVALDADLVVAGGNGFTPPDAIAKLREVGVAVIVLYAGSIEAALADIELLGRAVGAADEAADLASALRTELDGLTALVVDAPKPRVFYEIDAYDAIYTPAADSVYAEMLRRAGADPILTDASFVIALEELVAADPELILLGDAAYGVTADQVAARAGWAGLTAVRDGAIVTIDDILVTRPGPRLVDGLRALIAAIHPEIELPG